VESAQLVVDRWFAHRKPLELGVEIPVAISIANVYNSIALAFFTGNGLMTAHFAYTRSGAYTRSLEFHRKVGLTDARLSAKRALTLKSFMLAGMSISGLTEYQSLL